MRKKLEGGHEIYGLTTIGEKGQAVIPVSARNALKLKTGDKLIVLGMGGEMLTLAKLSNLEKFASHLAHHLKTVRSLINKKNFK